MWRICSNAETERKIRSALAQADFEKARAKVLANENDRLIADRMNAQSSYFALQNQMEQGIELGVEADARKAREESEDHRFNYTLGSLLQEGVTKNPDEIERLRKKIRLLEEEARTLRERPAGGVHIKPGGHTD
ncbi:hypothetical protein K491DRAFT_722075 [Lophiostoma macrostomum CBS 122681]|uniref:Uncharacterized protein n=1 Tax=Lophiostoma macrostomum CBS 122681 TaxID=1314788 RepID=A0A6A6SPS9_9PLEO|nr:hypothetical protein K491DRAFT_722075 [Lophiostoma macrostomum CBS 122681]